MSYHLRVKICGVTRLGDVWLAARLGADAIGLNFAPESPRFLPTAEAEALLRKFPAWVDPVGVFVNLPMSEVFHFANDMGRIRTVQWHGEDRELTEAFPFQVIQAFQIRDRKSIQEMNSYLQACRDVGRMPTAILLDGYSPKQRGGTGKTAPWKLIAESKPTDVPIILAGGLTPENVAEAVRIVKPYGVDVASGVEVNPGEKDSARVAEFIYNARLAASQL